MKRVFIVCLMFLVFAGMTFGDAVDTIKKVRVKKVIKKATVKPGIVQLTADLGISYMSVWGCKCKCAEKYDAMELGELTVEVFNKGIKTGAKVKVSFFDLKLGKMVTITRDAGIVDKFKYVEVKFADRLIKKSKGIKAYVKSTSGVKDPNLKNNSYFVKKCQYKQPR